MTYINGNYPNTIIHVSAQNQVSKLRPCPTIVDTPRQMQLQKQKVICAKAPSERVDIVFENGRRSIEKETV